MNFSFIDWIILVVYLILTLAVGFWVKRYLENLSSYLVAGRGIVD
jgi:Na+/proline symporter